MNHTSQNLTILSLTTVLILGGCAIGGTPMEHDISTALAGTILASIQSQVAASDSKLPAKALTAVYKDVNIGNLGIPSTSLQRRVFRLSTEGLVSTSIANSKRLEDLDATAPLQQSITLCGLVLLSDSLGANSSPNNIGVAPIGKIFLPIPTAPVRVEERYRVDAFETDSKAICLQSATTSFSYKVAGEYQHKLIGTLLKSNRITPVTDSVSCVNGKLENSHPIFKQTYFVTTCTHQSSREVPKYEKFLYLTESHFFLPIELKPNGAVTQFFEYQSE
jgi:hypothetical protein